jgi:Mitochondrial carrier protein
VLILQPFNYAKNMVQQQQPISMNPAHWYRGVFPNAVNMGSCTMIQFVMGGKLKQIVLGEEKQRKLTLKEEMMVGIGAGATSALVGSPLELIMIQQQRKGLGLGPTMQGIMQHGALYRGLAGATIRESLWTCGYLSIPPVVRSYLLEHHADQFPTNNAARIPAALLGGLFACYLTHPADTIKTCMQGDVERVTFDTFSKTAATLYSQSGIRAFYRGATFRYGRMVCAVFIMDYMKDAISHLLYPAAFQ